MTAPQPRPIEGSLFAPLRLPLYRSIWLATLASNFGTYIQTVATSWSMTEVSGRPEMVALVQTAANLPLMLFSILAGGLADLYPRRNLMLIAQSLMLAASAALAMTAFAGTVAPAMLLAFTFLIGCGNALHNPAWGASVADQVPRDLIPRAIALNALSNNTARSTGPAVGGVIVALAGASAAFLVNALSYVGMIVILLRWRPPPQGEVRARFARSLIEGACFAWRQRAVSHLLVRVASFTFATGAIWALMPLVARDRMQGDAALFGLLFGSFGAGAIGGAVASDRMRRAIGQDGVIRMGVVTFSAASATVGLTFSTPLVLIAHFLAGASWVLVLSGFNISLQLSLPRALAGRVLAIYQTTSFGGLSLGTLFWGWVAAVIGLAPAFLIAAIVMLAGGAYGVRRSLPQPSGEIFSSGGK